MKRGVIIVLSLLSLYACRNNTARISNNSNIIHISSEFASITLSKDNVVGHTDIVAETEVIRLDSKKGLIGRVKNTIVTDNNIVISDDNSVFVFDRDGNGISRINRQGRGPQDYAQLSHTTLTADNSKIVIYDNVGNKVLYFSLDGKYLSSTPGKFRFVAMEYSDIDEIVCTTYGWLEDPGLKGYRGSKDLVYFLNNKLEIEQSGMPLGHDKDKFKYISPGLRKFGDRVYVTPAFGDTIFLARNNALEARYHIDMREIGGEANFADKITNAEFEALTKRATTFYGDFIDADNHILISVGTPPDRRVDFYFYSKKSGKAYFYEQRATKAEYWMNSYVRSAKTSYRDKLVSIIEAYRVAGLPEELRGAIPELAGIKEEDNPVVVLYTLNEDL